MMLTLTVTRRLKDILWHTAKAALCLVELYIIGFGVEDCVRNSVQPVVE